jgi:hypothetical protein
LQKPKRVAAKLFQAALGTEVVSLRVVFVRARSRLWIHSHPADGISGSLEFGGSFLLGGVHDANRIMRLLSGILRDDPFAYLRRAESLGFFKAICQ